MKKPFITVAGGKVLEISEDGNVRWLSKKREELWRKWEDSSGLEKDHYEKQLLVEK